MAPRPNYGGEVHEDDGLPFDDVEGDFLDDDATGKWNLRNVSSNQGYVKRGTLSASRRPAGGDELAQGRLPDGKRNESDIPIDAAGAQYWHVFGSTATAFERFVVDHKITGPCWLNISKPVAIQDLQHYPNLNLARDPNSRLHPPVAPPQWSLKLPFAEPSRSPRLPPRSFAP
ncbi:DNA_pol_B_exo1 domain-containing protein [Rhodotorula toruloides]|nr:DNA_pol_B_exo1 domain-containing protein [Rhodotorula toruloides]